MKRCFAILFLLIWSSYAQADLTDARTDGDSVADFYSGPYTGSYSFADADSDAGGHSDPKRKPDANASANPWYWHRAAWLQLRL